MNIEQQVCSLENAKRLKELGVKQESLFYYQGRHEEIYEKGFGYGLWQGKRIEWEGATFVSAFTVAELGEMLPHVVKKNDELYYINPSAGGNGLCAISYITYRDGIGYLLTGHPVIYENTEADARAKMLIYLLENKLITL